MATPENSSTNVRTLTVYEKVNIPQRVFGPRVAVCHPEIRLTGRWLQQCVFKPGQLIHVTTERRRLTITVGWPDNEEPDDDYVK